jgi:predicted DNA-binding protein
MTGKPERYDVRTNIILPTELYERLRRAAFDERRSQTAIVRDALKRYLDARDRKGRTR